MLSPLSDRYELRHPLAKLIMSLMDLFLWVVSRSFSPIRKSSHDISVVKRVLLVNPAHIGDVVISTAAIRRLKEFNPHLHIGFVVGSWAKVALAAHPGVDKLYIVDHWWLNRTSASRLRKVWRYWVTWREARVAIKHDGYDLGILLNSFLPNLSSLLWFTDVPARIGYVSAGGEPMLSMSFPKPSSNLSEEQVQLTLLDAYGFSGRSASWLNVSDRNSTWFVAQNVYEPFVVLHPGTGNPAKAWVAERWIELARNFRRYGMHVVLTGRGELENHLATKIASDSGACNLVDQLSWQDWLTVLSKANLVVGVDSVVGHVCAAIETPFVGIYSGIGSVARWMPKGERIRVLTKNMPCSPCHTRPCRERTCIMSIDVETVLLAANQLLRSIDDSSV